MKTREILSAGVLMCAFLTVNGFSQTAGETNFSSDSLSIKNEFTAKPQYQPSRFKAETKFFPSEKSARQSTYVRPTKEARVKRYVSDAFGVPALIGSTFGATISQIGNNPPEWRRTAGGFAKRFASSYGTNAIRNTISFGISEAFGLENRFERSGERKFGKRLKHVVLGSYTTRTKNGKRILDFPHFIGTYSAAIIANETWMPKRFGYKDGLRDGTISLGVRFGVNLLREFVFPK